MVRHVTIDDAHEFSPEHLTVLKTLFRRSVFTLLGDFEDCGVLNRGLFQNLAVVMKLGESFRSPTAEFYEVWGEKDRADTALDIIENRCAQGHRSIAVLLSETERIDGFTRLLGDSTKIKGGVSILDTARSKGLEFDCVIIADAERFSLDGILLNIAKSRAVHTVDVLREV